jgi:energy-coupling factor transporter ATP-binding protein EcfA2
VLGLPDAREKKVQEEVTQLPMQAVLAAAGMPWSSGQAVRVTVAEVLAEAPARSAG